ncbi:response regulator [Desulfobaculum bizertense]|uniref:Response regulator receiver domain-containing protein n=1 Tax=Desulfobaculum bizertense DSM 18034 TaxID=1121442 RepID=A0A1T4VJA6_9BACT|nr:response regulator [Desulfobaculum bizertense]SKA65003.1 Response regulator receiver domain-containing protein [Desulfobaculum bizertense DSM 18034]
MTGHDSSYPQERTLSVLLVDDEKGYLEILQKRLKRRGILITGAPSGRDALQTLREQEFDLAVVDLKMQDMDGIELLKIFRRMVPDMPVLMLTGHGSQEAAQEGLRAGAFDYLTKPCELETLMKKMRAAARLKRAQS